MKVELKYVPVSLVDYNEGQLEGVPANPRTREDSRQEKLAESIEELPEMSEARPPMVLPHDGRYIVIGGNRRLEAFRDLNREKLAALYVKGNKSNVVRCCKCNETQNTNHKYKGVRFYYEDSSVWTSLIGENNE